MEADKTSIERALLHIRTRGDAASRFKCMGLPEATLRELCEKLMSGTVQAAVIWLRAHGDPIGCSSVHRFSDIFFEAMRDASQREVATRKAYGLVLRIGDVEVAIYGHAVVDVKNIGRGEHANGA